MWSVAFWSFRSKSVSPFCQKNWSREEGKILALNAPCQVWPAAAQGFGVLRVPYPKQAPGWRPKQNKTNFSGSTEFSATRVRTKISQCLGWVVELNSPGVNKHHKTCCLLLKCKTPTSELPPLAQDNEQTLNNLPWESKIPCCTCCLVGKVWEKADSR